MRILILACTLAAGLPGASSQARYMGGTLPGLREHAGVHFNTTDDSVLTFQVARQTVKVPYERINLLEYGQKVDRRYVMAALISPVFALSKRRQHFLTLGFVDEQGKQNAVVLQVEKSQIRSLLIALEARTGRKVQYQDDEARKAGRG